jgi:Family of unknown function (DUF6161)
MKLPTLITITDATGKSWQFEKLEIFTKFIKEEERFWKEKQKELEEKGFANTYLNVFSQLANIIALTKDIKTMLSSGDESSIKTHLTQFQASQLNPLSTSWIWSGHTFITSWLNSYKLSQATGDTFIQIILTKNINYPSLASFDYFKGCLLAYEYDLQDESLITKRRDAEKDSFNHLKDILVEEKNDLVGEISGFKTDAENIKKAYVDFMRLEGPAEYWNIRAKACKDQGDKWAGWLITAIIIAIATFGSLMLAWLNRFNTGVNFNNLEGVVIIAITLSLFVFALKTLAKLTFSSYHLQRDSEEREQLTHLYLALANDNKVDAESRNIVLQALFSRSESGLLTGESSPTLPVQDIINIIKNQKPY